MRRSRRSWSSSRTSSAKSSDPVGRRDVNFVLHGHSVSPGITIGRAHLVSSARMEVAHYEVPATQVEIEIARFDAAVGKVRVELEEVAKQIPADAPAEFGAFV